MQHPLPDFTKIVAHYFNLTLDYGKNKQLDKYGTIISVITTK